MKTKAVATAGILLLALGVALCCWLGCGEPTQPIPEAPRSGESRLGSPIRAAAEADGLRVELTAPKNRFKVSERKDLVVTVTNVSDKKLVVFRFFCVLQFSGKGATHMGMPGDPVRILADPRSLPSGKSAILVRGLSTRTGAWILEPGQYKVTAVYSFQKKYLADWPKGHKLPPGRIWTGTVKTKPLTIQVDAD